MVCLPAFQRKVQALLPAAGKFHKIAEKMQAFNNRWKNPVRHGNYSAEVRSEKGKARVFLRRKTGIRKESLIGF